MTTKGYFVIIYPHYQQNHTEKLLGSHSYAPHASKRYFPPTGHLTQELWSGVGVLAVLVVFVCAFASGLVLFLRLRKRRIGAGQHNKLLRIL